MQIYSVRSETQQGMLLMKNNQWLGGAILFITGYPGMIYSAFILSVFYKLATLLFDSCRKYLLRITVKFLFIMSWLVTMRQPGLPESLQSGDIAFNKIITICYLPWFTFLTVVGKWGSLAALSFHSANLDSGIRAKKHCIGLNEDNTSLYKNRADHSAQTGFLTQ